MDSYVPLSHFHTLSQAQVTEQMDKVSVDWDAALEMMRLAPMPASSSPRIDSLIDEFAETMAFVNSLPEPEQQSAAQGPGNDPNVAMGMMQPGLQPDFFSAAVVGQPHQTMQPFMAAEASFPAENADPFGMGFQQPDFSAAQLQLPAQQPAMAAPAPYFLPFLPELPMDAQAATFSAGQPIAPAAQPAVAQPSHIVKYAEMDGPTQKLYLDCIGEMLSAKGFKPDRGRANATKVRIEMVELLAAGKEDALKAKIARFAYKANNQKKQRSLKKSAKKGSASPSTPSSAASSAS